MEQEPTRTEITRSTHFILPSNNDVYSIAKAATKGIIWGIVETVATVIIVAYVTNWILNHAFDW
jgi:hypothetical protein